MLRVRATAPFTCRDLARTLDEKKIGNRMLFGGNLLRQPVFVQLRKDRPGAVRVIDRQGKSLTSEELERRLKGSTAAAAANDSVQSPLPGADEIMHRALFLGTYPGLSREMLEYEIAVVQQFVAEKTIAVR